MSSLVHAIRHECDWQLVAIARTFLALVFAAGLAISSKRKLVFFNPPILWMRSIAGSISLVCGFYALSRMPVADVLTLTNMFPVWVAVLSWPILKIPPRRDVWLAVVFGVIGVALIQQPHLVTGNFVWIVAVLASFTSALALIGLHKLHDIDPRAIVVHFSAVSLLFCLVALFVFPHSASLWSKIHGSTLLMLLGVGASATAGQILLTMAFARGDPARVSVIGLCQVGFGMIFDVIFWHRTFSPLTLAGISLIVIPTAWMMLRPKVAAPDVQPSV